MSMHKVFVKVCSLLLLLLSITQCQIQNQFRGLTDFNTPPPTLPPFNRNIAPPSPNLSVAPIIAHTVISTDAARESSKRLSEGAYKFSIELLSKISDVIHQNKADTDFMISPFAVWSLLLLLVEGAEGNTLRELREGLHINQDLASVRKAFRDVQSFLKINTSTIEVASLQAIFIDKNTPATNEYENNVQRDYGAELIGVDFQDFIGATKQINDVIKLATRGLIPYSVLPQDLYKAEMLLMSSLYFKGQWKFPFNSSLTRVEPFYDEDGNNTGDVEMMVQEADFRYVSINELEGHVLELPYGTQNRLAMLVIMPRKGVSVNRITHNLKKVTTALIFERLDSVSSYEDDVVEVFMPKFTQETHFALDKVLQEMGFMDMYSDNANFSRISSSVLLQTVIHSTKIIVNEEGTIAAAVATAILANKATPAKFYLNRPFVYLIVEKNTNVVLFGGEVLNPTKVASSSRSNAQG